MNIKPLLIALSISPVALSAANMPNDLSEISPLVKYSTERTNSDTADINGVVKDYVSALKSIEDVNTFIKSFRAEIYDLVDARENQKAQTLYNFAIETLDPLFKRMNEHDQWRAGEQLILIEQYMNDHEQFSKN